VRVEAWFAIATAFSSVPPFLRQAVIPVARKLRLPSLVAMPVAARADRYTHQDQTADGIARFCLLTHEIHVTGPHLRPPPTPVRPLELRGELVAVRHPSLDHVDIISSVPGETVRADGHAAVGLDRALVGKRVRLVLRAVLGVQMTVAHRRDGARDRPQLQRQPQHDFTTDRMTNKALIME
jgi:hypothetical protein